MNSNITNFFQVRVQVRVQKFLFFEFEFEFGQNCRVRVRVRSPATITRESRRRLKRYPLQVRQNQDLGRGFILLLPQAAVLPGSDAGSDVIKPIGS